MKPIESILMAGGWPTRKAVAFQLKYGTKWKAGHMPERVNLGHILATDERIADVESKLRKAYSSATHYRLYDFDGAVMVAGVL